MVVAGDATSGYDHARPYLAWLTKQLDVNLRHDALVFTKTEPDTPPFEASRSANVIGVKSGDILGIIGELKHSVLRGFKLPAGTAGFEIDLSQLAKLARQNDYQKLSKYPSVQQDISLKLPATTSYQELHDILAAELLGKTDTLASLTPLDIFQRSDDTQYKQLSFRLTISHYHKTLKSEEVNSLLDAAANVAHAKLNAERL